MVITAVCDAGSAVLTFPALAHFHTVLYGVGCDAALRHSAHIPAVADPRAGARLPARGRVGAADARRAGRLPGARAAVRDVRSEGELRRRPRAVRDPLEARGAAPPRPPGGWRGLAGAVAPRPPRGGPPRRARRPGRWRPVHTRLH